MKIIKTDVRIDALDPGVKLFVREKMAEGNTRFTDENVIFGFHRNGVVNHKSIENGVGRLANDSLVNGIIAKSRKSATK